MTKQPEPAPPKDWTLAAGTAGFNVGTSPVFGRYAYGRALYVFPNRAGYWTGVITGSHSTSGATLQEACDRATMAAASAPARQKRTLFEARMSSKERLAS